ncbi:hypothetical protein [Adlercreutzia sp. ZJ176]|uniref:hypothetical protein n=1 Tax=Adlercreutzia sp. ZJ176 TaxID=2709407 RepID=UPI00197DC398|nr:hypothetical protein [Adlercreutzia sp. ZJ176]
MEELRSRFKKLNIEEMGSADIAKSIEELDCMRARVDELNRENAALVKKYDGDEKYARAHKRAMRTPPPLTTSPSKMSAILKRVKGKVDGMVLSNSGIIGNKSYFQRGISRILAESCKAGSVKCDAAQITGLASYIASEYVDERGKAA